MKSIRSRYISVITVAVIISVVVLGGVSMQFIRKISRFYLEELMKLRCTNIEKRLDAHLNEAEYCVDTAAHYAGGEFDDSSDETLQEYSKKVNSLMGDMMKNSEVIITYYYRIAPEVSDTEKGFWYTKYNSSEFEETELTDLEAYSRTDMSRTGWYYIPKATGKAVWLEPYNNDNLGGKKMISYAAPVYSGTRFIGVIGVDYDYDELIKYMAYDGNFKDAYTFLVNSSDSIIYHPQVESGTEVTAISEKLGNVHLPAEQAAIPIEYNGETQLVTWSNLTNDMRLFLVVPERSMKAMWYWYALTYILAAAVVLVVFVVIVSLLASRVVRPLTKLTEAAEKIDQGDYNVDLDYSRDDEVGVLTNTFKKLIGHLQEHISDLNDKAYKDALTSVRNKGAFDSCLKGLEEKIQTAGEGGSPEFAICVFDCNNLKDINDTYGHEKGDIYLKKACSTICEVFRHSPVFRMGGDEFVAVLENEDYKNRLELCTKFDRLCAELTEASEEPWEAVRIASGIAVYMPENDRSAYEVFRRADGRMYEDKARKKKGIIRDLTMEMVSD